MANSIIASAGEWASLKSAGGELQALYGKHKFSVAVRLVP
jgi:hypothetical protein